MRTPSMRSIPWRRFLRSLARAWRALPRKRTVVAIALLAILLASAVTAGTLRITAARITAADQKPWPQSIDPRQRAQLYQQLLGDRSLPTPAQMAAARAGAPRLPVATFSLARAPGGPKLPTFPATWASWGQRRI